MNSATTHPLPTPGFLWLSTHLYKMTLWKSCLLSALGCLWFLSSDYTLSPELRIKTGLSKATNDLPRLMVSSGWVSAVSTLLDLLEDQQHKSLL